MIRWVCFSEGGAFVLVASLFKFLELEAIERFELIGKRAFADSGLPGIDLTDFPCPQKSSSESSASIGSGTGFIPISALSILTSSFNRLLSLKSARFLSS